MLPQTVDVDDLYKWGAKAGYNRSLLTKAFIALVQYTREPVYGRPRVQLDDLEVSGGYFPRDPEGWRFDPAQLAGHFSDSANLLRLKARPQVGQRLVDIVEQYIIWLRAQ